MVLNHYQPLYLPRSKFLTCLFLFVDPVTEFSVLHLRPRLKDITCTNGETDKADNVGKQFLWTGFLYLGFFQLLICLPNQVALYAIASIFHYCDSIFHYCGNILLSLRSSHRGNLGRQALTEPSKTVKYLGSRQKIQATGQWI